MDTFFILDAAVFLAFIAAVILVGILMSRHEKDSESYFLAGRGLSWWLIGFSLIAANISTEQFVGMSGQAADYLGLAIASYEWMAAITLVVVAFFFLPKFLRSGIYTIPEFLEYRFNHQARTLMSILMMLTYVLVTIAAVIYSGAKTVDVLVSKSGDEVAADAEPAADEPAPDEPAAEEDAAEKEVPEAPRQAILGIPINVFTASWAIGILAAVYVVAGGLKACAWADLLQGSALILGGTIVVVLAMAKLGGAAPGDIGLPAELAQSGALERFRELNADKLHMVLPWSDKFVPWTALVIGLWIPNFYYWGLNQYITQRTLGSASLAEGQKGVVFAAGMKLLIPFIIVFPGIIAFNLYKSDMQADAMATTNKPTLESFEKHRDNPAGSRMAFEFNEDFAYVYPELAGQLVQFNSKASELPVPTDAEPAKSSNAPERREAALLVAQNKELLSEISDKNDDAPKGEEIETQKQLIGYQFDSAFGLLIKKLIPPGLRGFMLAAILGAVMSSLASMLNAASTIFTMDIYRQYINKGASQFNLVLTGRACVVLFAAIGCGISPLLDNPKFGGIFTYIQEFQGFISPGILAVFIYGLFIKRTPRAAGVVGLILSPVIYALLKFVVLELPLDATTMALMDSFLNRMAITFFAVLLVLGIMTVVRPLPEPVKMPEQTKIALTSSRGAMLFGIVVVVATLILYADLLVRSTAHRRKRARGNPRPWATASQKQCPGIYIADFPVD